MSTKKVVFQGQKGIYSTTGIKTLPNEELLAIKNTEEKLKNLGFKLISDLYCSQFESIVSYCYGQPQGKIWAIVMKANSFSPQENLAGIDFSTAFTSGAFLTTTTVKLTIKDFKSQKIFRRSHPKLDIAKLYDRHQEHTKELAKQEGSVKVMQNSISTIAAAIDDYLIRQNSSPFQTIKFTLATYINAIGIAFGK